MWPEVIGTNQGLEPQNWLSPWRCYSLVILRSLFLGQCFAKVFVLWSHLENDGNTEVWDTSPKEDLSSLLGGWGEKSSLKVWKLLVLNTQLKLQLLEKILTFGGIQRMLVLKEVWGVSSPGRMLWTEVTRQQPSGAGAMGTIFLSAFCVCSFLPTVKCLLIVPTTWRESAFLKCLGNPLFRYSEENKS